MRTFLATRSLSQYAGLAMIAAGLMAFVFQAWKNAKTATRYSEGSDIFIDAVGGIAPELFVAAAAVGVIALRNSGKLESGKSLWALMALCVGFGVFASFQQISVGRVERTADAVTAQANLGSRSTEIARKQAELSTIKVRPSAQIEGDINAWKARHAAEMERTAECTRPSPKPSSICQRLARLKGEHGAASRVTKLEADIAALSAKNEGTRGKHVTADPAAEWLAAVTGWETRSSQMAIAGFMAVVMMLVGMFGVHFGLLIYGLGATASAPASAEILPIRPAAIRRDAEPAAVSVGRPVFARAA